MSMSYDCDLFPLWRILMKSLRCKGLHRLHYIWTEKEHSSFFSFVEQKNTFHETRKMIWISARAADCLYNMNRGFEELLKAMDLKTDTSNGNQEQKLEKETPTALQLPTWQEGGQRRNRHRSARTMASDAPPSSPSPPPPRPPRHTRRRRNHRPTHTPQIAHPSSAKKTSPQRVSATLEVLTPVNECHPTGK